MSKLLGRIAATLLALPLAATSGAIPASADVTLPGCYGAGVVVCDPTVEYGLPVGAETYQTQFPVCAGSCTYVPLTLVRTAPGEPLHLCVSYRNMSGTTTRECAGVPDTGWLVEAVLAIVRDVTDDIPDTGELTERVLEIVRDVADQVPDPKELARAILDFVVEAAWDAACTALATLSGDIMCAN